MGSEQINKPSLGRRSSSGVHLLANLFLTFSSTRAPGTPSAHDLSPSSCRAPPSLCLQGKPSWRIPQVPEPAEPSENWPGTWWRKAEARCMAAGQGGAALPAGPRWTGHLPGWRGWSWLQFPYSALREREGMKNFRDLQALLSISPCPDALQRTKGGNMHCETTLSTSSQGALNLQLIFEDLFMAYKHFCVCDPGGAASHSSVISMISYPRSWWRSKAPRSYVTPTQSQWPRAKDFQ